MSLATVRSMRWQGRVDGGRDMEGGGRMRGPVVLMMIDDLADQSRLPRDARRAPREGAYAGIRRKGGASADDAQHLLLCESSRGCTRPCQSADVCPTVAVMRPAVDGPSGLTGTVEHQRLVLYPCPPDGQVSLCP